jgi:hypothetical protein
MTSERRVPTADEGQFLAALSALAASFDWELRSFTRENEFVVVVGLDNDPSFEQLLWVYNAKDATMRCLLASRSVVAPEHEGVILELCARINAGLVFGCAEYSFEDKAVIFRDSSTLRLGALVDVVESTSARLLDLGARYATAIVLTLAGTSPAEAVARVESARGG